MDNECKKKFLVQFLYDGYFDHPSKQQQQQPNDDHHPLFILIFIIIIIITQWREFYLNKKWWWNSQKSKVVVVECFWTMNLNGSYDDDGNIFSFLFLSLTIIRYKQTLLLFGCFVFFSVFLLIDRLNSLLSIFF